MNTSSLAADNAVAWARDPTHIVVVWEVSAATRMRALRALGPDGHHARAALRVVAENGATSIDLPPDATMRVINASPGGRYVLEIGIRAASGEFIALARSGRVETPPAEPTPDTSVTWVTATAPKVPIEATWSGRRVPFVPVDLGRSRSSNGV